MTGFKVKERRINRGNGHRWRIQTADDADDRMRQQSRKADLKYWRLLQAAGHLPAMEANERG